MNDSVVDSYLEQQVEAYQNSPKFVAEGLALGVAEEIALLISGLGLNQTQLAAAMGVSRSHVSQLLNAPPNITLMTLARLGIAFGVKPMVKVDGGHQIIPALTNWEDVEDQATESAYLGYNTGSTVNMVLATGRGGANDAST